MKELMIGVDLARRVFQVHGALTTGEAQARALADPELETLKQEITRVRAQIEACDAAIEAAEIHHTAMVERHEAALRQEAGPAREIRQSPEDALRNASFPDLRVLAAETVEPDDDRIVDKLVQLRKILRWISRTNAMPADRPRSGMSSVWQRHCAGSSNRPGLTARL